MKCTRAILLLFFIFIPRFVHAESVFRCGDETVSIGETKYEVLIRCGRPDFRDVAGALYGYPDEIWYYDCGPDRFIKILHFRDSRLSSIETGGYGSENGLPCPSSSEWKTRKEPL